MDKTELVMKVLELLDVRTDSLEIGSASKGGVVKVYGDFENEQAFKDKIDKAMNVRAHAQSKQGGEGQ